VGCTDAAINLRAGGWLGCLPLKQWQPLGTFNSPQRSYDRNSIHSEQFAVVALSDNIIFIRDFTNAYPDALLFGSPDLPKLSNLHFDGVLELPAPEWSADLDKFRFAATYFMTK